MPVLILMMTVGTVLILKFENALAQKMEPVVSGAAKKLAFGGGGSLLVAVAIAVAVLANRDTNITALDLEASKKPPRDAPYMSRGLVSLQKVWKIPRIYSRFARL